jgi:hypothetical protein
MAMPEAPMDKHDCPMFRQNDVGTSRQIGSVQTKAKPEAMRGLPGQDFGRRVPVAHCAHVVRPSFAGQVVNHNGSTKIHPRRQRLDRLT